MLLIDLALVVMLLAMFSLVHAILAPMLHISAFYLHYPPLVAVD